MDQEGVHKLAEAVLVLVPMILSLTVHEFSHAWMARRLGDSTAEEHGRLTLNPIAHIDPIGTLLLPLVLTLQGAGYFGWAKPVPFNPVRFHRNVSMRKGSMLVALAGPVSNLLLAFVAGALLSALAHSGGWQSTPEAMRQLLVTIFWINITLFVFNMIPVGPLDGQKVLAGLLGGNTAAEFDRINARFGVFGLLLLLVLLQAPFGAQLFARPVSLIRSGLSAVLGLG